MKRVVFTLMSSLVLVSAAAAAEMVTGKVANVQPDKKQFSLRVADEKTLMFTVDDKSVLRLRRGPITLNELAPGTELKVTYEERGGTRHLLTATQQTVSTSELKREVRDSLAAAKEYTFQNKDQYLARLKNVMDSLDDELDDLRKEAHSASGEVKKELDREIADLQKKRDELHARMPAIKKASAEAWNDLKKGFGEADDDFQKAWEKARSRFKD
jgi:hypothetical protein